MPGYRMTPCIPVKRLHGWEARIISLNDPRLAGREGAVRYPQHNALTGWAIATLCPHGIGGARHFCNDVLSVGAPCCMTCNSFAMQEGDQITRGFIDRHGSLQKILLPQQIS